MNFLFKSRPGEKETFGLIAKIDIFDHIKNQYTPFRFLIDSLSSAIWLVSSFCITEICKMSDSNKYLPVQHLYGDAKIELNTGIISGNIYFTSINLKSFILNDQSILLANQITVPEFKNSKIDGVLGISKNLSNLHNQQGYNSVLQNIQNKHLPGYFILRLGGNNPYIKFGNINNWDYQFFHKDKNSQKFTEKIEFINLPEKGKLVLALRHIRLLYRDQENNIVRSEYAVSECIHNGCRATLDTKSYYIYGPSSQLQAINTISASECSENTFQDLPDIEFSFYDVKINQQNKSSNRTVEVTLEPSDYMINIHENSIDDGSSGDLSCRPGIADHGTQYGWNLGIMFMKKLVILYEFEEDRLGFVRSNNEH